MREFCPKLVNHVPVSFFLFYFSLFGLLSFLMRVELTVSTVPVVQSNVEQKTMNRSPKVPPAEPVA
jgi:hypothetical protein